MQPDSMYREVPRRVRFLLALPDGSCFETKAVIKCPSVFQRSKRIQQTGALRKTLITQRCGCILALTLKHEGYQELYFVAKKNDKGVPSRREV